MASMRLHEPSALPAASAVSCQPTSCRCASLLPLHESYTHEQGPTVEPIGKELRLMAEPENDEVDEALETYTHIRHSIMSLQIEVRPPVLPAGLDTCAG